MVVLFGNDVNVAVYVAAFIGNILSLVCGIASTWPSPVLAKLTDEDHLEENPFGEVISSEAESWIGSLMSLGAVLGPIPSGLLSDRIGRKPTLLILSVPLFLAFVSLAFSNLVILYCVARFVTGFAVGGSFSVIPMYIAEIAEVQNRGILTSFFNGILTLGMLVSYTVGPYVHLRTFNLICAAFPVLFFILFLLFCPESPTYLISRNETGKARDALERVRIKGSSKAIENELQEIKQEAENNAQGSIGDFIHNRGLIKALIIAMLLVGFQPLSGCDVVQFYTQPIFEETGTDIPSDIASIALGVVQLVVGLIAPFFVDRAGRRPLLLLSAVVMALAEAPLGLYFYLHTQTDHDTTSIFWLPILCLILYIVAFNYGFGPLPWTVMGEVFPSHLKTLACGITTSFVWTLSFATTRSFLAISEAISTGGTFWLFTGFTVLAGVFVLFAVPETKGKTFSQIQKEFNM